MSQTWTAGTEKKVDFIPNAYSQFKKLLTNGTLYQFPDIHEWLWAQLPSCPAPLGALLGGYSSLQSSCCHTTSAAQSPGAPAGTACPREDRAGNPHMKQVLWLFLQQFPTILRGASEGTAWFTPQWNSVGVIWKGVSKASAGCWAQSQARPFCTGTAAFPHSPWVTPAHLPHCSTAGLVAHPDFPSGTGDSTSHLCTLRRALHSLLRHTPAVFSISLNMWMFPSSKSYPCLSIQDLV